jgi:hypothetical protein
MYNIVLIIKSKIHIHTHRPGYNGYGFYAGIESAGWVPPNERDSVDQWVQALKHYYIYYWVFFFCSLQQQEIEKYTQESTRPPPIPPVTKAGTFACYQNFCSTMSSCGSRSRSEKLWTWTWGLGPGSAKSGQTGPGLDLKQSSNKHCVSHRKLELGATKHHISIWFALKPGGLVSKEETTIKPLIWQGRMKSPTKTRGSKQALTLLAANYLRR